MSDTPEVPVSSETLVTPVEVQKFDNPGGETAPAAAPAPQPADWAFLVDPKEPAKSLVVYKGVPLDAVIGASVTLETKPFGKDGSLVVVSILNIQVATQSLALGTLVNKPQ